MICEFDDFVIIIFIVSAIQLAITLLIAIELCALLIRFNKVDDVMSRVSKFLFGE